MYCRQKCDSCSSLCAGGIHTEQNRTICQGKVVFSISTLYELVAKLYNCYQGTPYVFFLSSFFYISESGQIVQIVIIV